MVIPVLRYARSTRTDVRPNTILRSWRCVTTYWKKKNRCHRFAGTVKGQILISESVELRFQRLFRAYARENTDKIMPYSAVRRSIAMIAIDFRLPVRRWSFSPRSKTFARQTSWHAWARILKRQNCVFSRTNSSIRSLTATINNNYDIAHSWIDVIPVWSSVEPNRTFAWRNSRAD